MNDPNHIPGWSKTNGEQMLDAAIARAHLVFWTKVILVLAAIGCAVKYILS